MPIDFLKVEKKWQAAWEDAGIFHAKEDSKKKKFYNLEMFPYPSASFLHMGHVRNYTIGDIIARFKRMQGFNVLYPFGYDSFGLPAENAAKKAGVHPKKYTEDAIKKITEYLKALGNSYDWSRTLATHEPEYYKWNQWFFLKFLERGLVYRKKAPVNWCPDCNSTLANEEVVAGCCWRHETTQVQQKELEQWFLRTTAYADELLKDIDKLNWSDRIKNLQRNWIGKSHGVLIDFQIKGSKNKLQVFTTRPDTVFGVKFVTVSPKHPLIAELTKENKNELEKLKTKAQSEEDKDKEGVFLGSYAINPFTNEEVPVYAANFVVAEYGTGAVMAVPAHDQRDFEFAKKYKITIKEVIIPKDRNCIIVHGSNSSEKKAKEGQPENLRHWKPWLKDNLEKNGIKTSNDLYPEDWLPEYNKWKKVFEKNTITENTILVGHSAGTAFLLRWLGENKKKVDKLVLVAPSLVKSDKYKYLSKLKDFAYDSSLKKYFNKLVIFYSDNDNTNIIESVNQVHSKLGGDLVMIKNMGHFCYEDMHTEKFPELLTVILKSDAAFVDEGVLINSGQFTGLNSKDAIAKISEFAEKNKFGKRITQYKLRDWLISRQRYWGTPIPIIYCEKCGAVPVPEKELPVLLPEKVDFTVQGNPIKSVKSWLEVKCPKCKSPAIRESDTMGGFVDSSWYFLRYCSPQENKSPFNKQAAEYWMPVNQYIGGIEHAVGHLIYSRFWTKVLRDMKLLNFDEPFSALFNQGIVYKDGHKMSKSFGNVVYQTDISEKYGIDTARIFLMSVGAPESDMEWSDSGVEGAFRLLQKISKIAECKFKKPDARDEHKRNSFIKKYTAQLENLKFNLAVIELAQYADYLTDNLTKEGYETLLILLSPFAPHTAEELWHVFGKKSFVSVEHWPKADEKAIKPEIEQQEQAINKTIQDIRQILKIVNTQAERSSAGPRGTSSALELPKKIYLYAIPKDLDTYKQMVESLKKEFSAEVEVWANNNQSKYDPEHKAEKAKPGKPGIYIEA